MTNINFNLFIEKK